MKSSLSQKPLPAGAETTVEQQLEAQGDQEEAEPRPQSSRPTPGAIRAGHRHRTAIRRKDRRRQARGSTAGTIRTTWSSDRGDSIIIDLGGGQIYVQPVVPDDADRLLYGADNVEVQQLRGGRTRTIVYRRNGVQIITIRDRYGDIIRRVKRLPNGSEIVLYDNRFDEDDGDRRRPPILLDVRRPRIDIPERRVHRRPRPSRP